MPALTPKTLIIIPVYNEDATLLPVYQSIRHYYSGDIVFINDGSQDNSCDIIQGLVSNQVRVIHQPGNLGYGRTLIEGFSFAIRQGYDYVLTMDCDAQHEPAKIPDFFAAIPGFDIVSGSRYLLEDRSDDIPPPDRVNINERITAYLNDILPFRLTDSFCGFKAYNLEALKRFCLDEPGYAFPLQLWIQAGNFNLRVAELPVPRVYQNLERSFGVELDDPATRLDYYYKVIEKERTRWT